MLLVCGVKAPERFQQHARLAQGAAETTHQHQLAPHAVGPDETSSAVLPALVAQNSVHAATVLVATETAMHHNMPIEPSRLLVHVGR